MKEEINYLVETDDHCNTNRMLYLLGHRRFHTDQNQKALKQIMENDCCPGLFLKKILNQICHLKVLIFGHVLD